MTTAGQVTASCYSERTVPAIKNPIMAVNEFLSWQGVSSIQMTFHEDKPPEIHSMPPGGFRLAIVNCWNLEMGFEVRERLASLFQSSLSSAKVAA